MQEIEGQVTIDNPIPLTELVKFENITVPPVKRSDSTRFVDAGRLVTHGFPNVVLSLHGQVKGEVLKPGVAGAVLIPEEEMIQLAFNEQGMMHFALETTGGVSKDAPYFASAQPRFVIGFSSYKVYLYNTSDKTVTVDLFAYLTN